MFHKSARHKLFVTESLTYGKNYNDRVNYIYRCQDHCTKDMNKHYRVRGTRATLNQTSTC